MWSICHCYLFLLWFSQIWAQNYSNIDYVKYFWLVEYLSCYALFSPVGTYTMATCTCVLWCIFWIVILIFLAWPLSIFLGALYGFLAPLTTCIGLDKVTDLLLQGVNLGRTCAEYAREGKSLCWAGDLHYQCPDQSFISRQGHTS